MVEIGCGGGRDAKEIAERAEYYHGVDISGELINLARSHVPDTDFEVADAVTYKFPKNLDIVFAFASLLHLDKREVKAVLDNAHKSLKPGGVFYVSLKYMPAYTQKVKDDEYGRRLFYFYNPELIKKLAGSGYESVHEDVYHFGNTDWFKIALRSV